MNPQATSMPAAGAWSLINDLLRDDLQAVDRLLAAEVHRGVPVIDEMARAGCLGGGKRFRPILLFLAARATGQVSENHVRLATAIEMIHAATLVHDDILDEAATRRFSPTINSRWGSHGAVLFGDYLFTHAFYLASTTGDAESCAIIGRATNEVCEGELRQMSAAGCFSLAVADYFHIIGQKTAALCECATKLGARLADGTDHDVRVWSRAGRLMGVAFQIIDDVLDFAGDARQCGKTLGTDLATAKPTLPVLLALSREAPAVRRHWQARLESGEASREEVVCWLEQRDALDDARCEAQRCIEEAVALARSYDHPASRAFEDLARFLLARQH